MANPPKTHACAEDLMAAAELRTMELPTSIQIAPGVTLTITGERGETDGIWVDLDNAYVEVPIEGKLRIGVGELLRSMSLAA